MDRDDSSLASTLPKTLQQHLLQGQSGNTEQGERNAQQPSVQPELFGSLDQSGHPNSSYFQHRQTYSGESLSFPPPYPRPSNFRPQSWHGGDPGPSSIANVPLPPIRSHLTSYQATPPGGYVGHAGPESTSSHEYGEHEEWDEDSIASPTEHESTGSHGSPHHQRRDSLRQSHPKLAEDLLYHENASQRVTTQSALFHLAADTKGGPSETKKRAEFEDRPFKTSSSPTLSEQEYDPSEKGKGKGTKRKKTAVACNFCRGRKLRCDGKKPMCGNCELRNSHECKYAAFVRRRGPGKAPKGSRKKKRELTSEHETAPTFSAERGEPSSAASSSSAMARPPSQMPRYSSQSETTTSSAYTPFHEVFPSFEPAAAAFPYRPRHIDYEGTGLNFIYNHPPSGMRATSGQHEFTDAPPRIGLTPSTLTYPSQQRSSSQFAFPHTAFPESVSASLPTSTRYQPPPYSDGGAYWRNEATAASSSEMAPFGRRPSSLHPTLPFHTQSEPYFPRQLTSSERDGGSTEQRYMDLEQPGLDPGLSYRSSGFGMLPRFTEGAQGNRILARLGESTTAETRTGPYEEYSASSQQIGLDDSQTNARTFRPRPNVEQHERYPGPS